MNFRERVKRFWLAFESHEAELRRLIDTDQRKAEEFFAPLIKKAFTNIYFELGKTPQNKYKIVLSAEGCKAKSFATYYWHSAAPRAYADNWVFYPLKPADFLDKYKIEEKSVRPDEVLVSCILDDQRDIFDITLYYDGWTYWDPSFKTKMMFCVLDGVLGEENVEKYIGKIKFSDCEPPAGALKLSGLLSFIINTAKERGWEKEGKITRIFTAYERKPDRDDTSLRADIFWGLTSLFGISTNVERNTPVFKELERDGIESGCLTILNNLNEVERMPKIKSEIEKRILAISALPSMAEITGSANGTARSYLDFIIYDYKGFTEALDRILGQYKEAEIYFYKFTDLNKPIPVNTKKSFFQSIFGI